ncbi:MAG: S-layer protein, partial [Candidatus Iainarchaeum sp.]
MKGLNVKRIAALGIGAALVGSALAPAVMAGVFNNVNSLQKSNIVNTTGTPVVDIVVGSMGQAADVVWAGNIAAKVAQLATVDATEGAATVDYTVGGTTSVAGAGELEEVTLGDTATMTVTSSKMPSLVNTTSFKYKWDNSTTQKTMSLTETISGVMATGAQMETGSSRYAIGEMTGTVAKNALSYKLEFGAALDLDGVVTTGLDANSGYDLQIPILGKTYVLDEVKSNGTWLVFYANTNPTDLVVGESVEVAGKGTYAGKTLSVELVDLVQIGSGNQFYRAKWALKDGSSGIKFVEKDTQSGAYNLKEEFGDLFSDNIFVTAAGLNLAANKYTATIRTGDDRLEIRDGRGFPYTDNSTEDNKAQWMATLDKDDNKLTGITISNQWAYNKTIGSQTDTSKYVLKVGENISLPNDYAKFELIGFQSKPSKELTLGNSELKYSDLKGKEITVPFYKQFDFQTERATLITVAGQDYTLWFNDNNVYYTKGDQTGADTFGDLTSASIIESFEYNSTGKQINLDLGVRPYSGSASDDVKYVVAANKVTGMGYLLLAAQTFHVYNRGGSLGAQIEFTGTLGGDVNAGGYFADLSSDYYRPNMTEFTNDVMNWNVTGPQLVASDKNAFAALFKFKDATTESVVTLAIKADEDGDVWNYNSLVDLSDQYTNYGPSLDASYADWRTKA